MHDQDNDAETDEELIDIHIKECKKELTRAVNEFLNGDALKLIRNVREEFSGIELIDITNETGVGDDDDDSNEREDHTTSRTLSSWYEIVSTNS